MQNSYYCVEGITARFIKSQVWEDSETVRIFMSTRYYDLSFEEIPEVLRHWIPVDLEGSRAYDHTLAELGIKPPVVSSDNDVAEQDESQEEQVLQIKELLIKAIIDQNRENAELKDRLTQVIHSLKDPKNGIYATAVIQQTKGIVSAVNAFQKINANNLEAFNQAIRLFTEFNKKQKRK